MDALPQQLLSPSTAAVDKAHTHAEQTFSQQNSISYATSLAMQLQALARWNFSS
jgi:hypothetical protein